MMKRKDFNSYIDGNNISALFNEMGWNHPDRTYPLSITIDDVDYNFNLVAEKCGFQVFTCEVDCMPVNSMCKKIDCQLRKQAFDYICVFILNNTKHHFWVTPVKTNEKRELVKTEYIGGNQADFLWAKIEDMSFGFDEHITLPDVKQKVQGTFQVNSEKITKDFYTQFRKEHKAFATHISGISNEKDRDWYTSVMLNRLMFCYFIQKKGFLDGDYNYLKNKLDWVKQQKGENKFFDSFYKGFLCAMFHEGLNFPRHDENDEFVEKYGRIPYLNGGMFDDHQLECENTGIDISDEAFERLFSFFDKWEWHLDTRLTASGKDINPDVLGYIFEQYINDRSAMGAYYTKEDITEYIGKNCIIPFLMDKTKETTPAAFKPNGYVWKSLRESGKTYIYDAVKKGYTDDWQHKIPDYIQQGIALLPAQHDLLKRRSRWNEKTSEEFALPTEIWRETIERLQRCETLQEKIASGDITNINDFITYNLDIRRFCEDIIRNTEDHLYVEHFYAALQHITILDPTCGSGAFLFAAMNILEPLYEACIDRMEEWHMVNTHLFEKQLGEIEAKYSSNRQYFIFKSIILRNLYGVDIMVEATEIAKLRLFLKMVAVVEVDKRKDNLGLDPLPDIDFNIKCGNTLVGYATERELDDALAYGDMFANKELKKEINKQMNKVASNYKIFRDEQLKSYDDNATLKDHKDSLRNLLKELNSLLNKHMYSTIALGSDFDKWEKSHQPFHWLAEFYQIIKGNGGFDVIIGNPPYVVYNEKNFVYKVKDYETYNCKNLYAYVFERSFRICPRFIGLIVQMSAIATEGMRGLQEYLLNDKCSINYSIYPERPKQLFDGACIALSIIICNRNNKDGILQSRGVSRFCEIQRETLFKNIKYIKVDSDDFIEKSKLFPKFRSILEKEIISKLKGNNSIAIYFTHSNSKNKFAYRSAGGRYWKPILNRSFKSDSSSNKIQYLKNTLPSTVIVAVLNSNLFWWHYVNSSDLFNLPIGIFNKFRFSDCKKDICDDLNLKGLELMKSYEKNKTSITQFIQSRQHETVSETFNPQVSKSIIDEIDKLLATHYGFTEEELDFIINYDIKYRMGDEL